ncbi:MAG TPA: hypothetical protein VJQ52_11960 [Steroidobacteraceae bacterium]|nr:hypothetical protein [Steroidobacteraceae bacterium]
MRWPISRCLSSLALPIADWMRWPANACVSSRKMTSEGPSGTADLDQAPCLILQCAGHEHVPHG